MRSLQYEKFITVEHELKLKKKVQKACLQCVHEIILLYSSIVLINFVPRLTF